jgi:hypothetical protein
MWKAISQNKLTIYKANLPSFVKKIIKSRCYVDLSRRLRLKSHPKMAAWQRLIDSNNLNASSRKFPSFQVHSRLKMQREKTNNNNSSRDKETNREHSRIRSTNIEQKWKLLYFDAFIFWRTSCSHYVSLIIVQLSAINYGKFIFQTKL